MNTGRCFLVSFLMIFFMVQPVWGCAELMPVQPVTDQQYPIYADLLQCMAVYETFLSERDQIDDLLFPTNGRSLEQAQSYLQKGFTCSFSYNLLLYLTRWNSDHGRLQLIPGEGFPILTGADFNDLYYRVLDDGSIIFQRDYYDCYRAGDCYHFQITAGEYPSGWLIQSFNLIECPSASLTTCE